MNRRTRITEDWQPDDAGRAFASQNGVPESEIGAFVDFHLAKGDTMASWPAAWRTWCRNAVRFGTATGRPAAPLLSVVHSIDPSDSYGVEGWARTLRNAVPDTYQGKPVLTIGGFPVVSCAVEICQAAGFGPTDRPDLNLISEWLALSDDTMWPDRIIEIVRAGRRPDRPTLRFWDGRVRERAGRAA